MTTLPLSGITVLDLSRVLAGPLCTQYLGDMGADIIKVENTGHGDDMRVWPPFKSSEKADIRTGSPFLSVNRNKRAIAVDLKHAQGREVVLRLAKSADIVVESFGPGVAERLGVDARTLRAENPRLIYCSISGYGSEGSMKHGKGYDVILQAFSGMLAVTGEPDRPPVRAAYSPVDQGTGLNALIGILAALHARERDGKGCVVEASLYDTATGFLGYMLQNVWTRGSDPGRYGAAHEALCPYELFETADKPIILGVANDSLWRAFCRVAELEQIADDPRFATNAQRVKHRAETVGRVQEALRCRPRNDWVQRLEAAGIPCSPLHTMSEMVAHPHARESGMIFDYQHPWFGELHTVAQPVKFDGRRSSVRRPVPMLGEHTIEVLREAGYSAEVIEDMLKTGAVREFRETAEQSQ